jgi:hypothetical protein
LWRQRGFISIATDFSETIEINGAAALNGVMTRALRDGRGQA